MYLPRAETWHNCCLAMEQLQQVGGDSERSEEELEASSPVNAERAFLNLEELWGGCWRPRMESATSTLRRLYCTVKVVEPLMLSEVGGGGRG
jgi:hypothetical protein